MHCGNPRGYGKTEEGAVTQKWRSFNSGRGWGREREGRTQVIKRRLLGEGNFSAY